MQTNFSVDKPGDNSETVNSLTQQITDCMNSHSGAKLTQLISTLKNKPDVGVTDLEKLASKSPDKLKKFIQEKVIPEFTRFKKTEDVFHSVQASSVESLTQQIDKCMTDQSPSAFKLYKLVQSLKTAEVNETVLEQIASRSPERLKKFIQEKVIPNFNAETIDTREAKTAIGTAEVSKSEGAQTIGDAEVSKSANAQKINSDTTQLIKFLRDKHLHVEESLTEEEALKRIKEMSDLTNGNRNAMLRVKSFGDYSKVVVTVQSPHSDKTEEHDPNFAQNISSSTLYTPELYEIIKYRSYEGDEITPMVPESQKKIEETLKTLYKMNGMICGMLHMSEDGQIEFSYYQKKDKEKGKVEGVVTSSGIPKGFDGQIICAKKEVYSRDLKSDSKENTFYDDIEDLQHSKIGELKKELPLERRRGFYKYIAVSIGDLNLTQS